MSATANAKKRPTAPAPAEEPAAAPDAATIAQALAAPFDPAEVKFKAQTVSGSRALAVAYVDARVIQDRLDDALGVMGWQDSYECLPDGSVVCRLRVRVGAEWITKEDVGAQSEQPDEGDRRKAAFSDALKRAAVKFGIGRYLYRLPSQWVDYDPQKRRLLSTPQLPGAARPRALPAQAPAPVAVQALSPAQTQPQEGKMSRRVRATEAKLVGESLCQPGELTTHLLAELGGRLGQDMALWPDSAEADVGKACKEFEAWARGRLPADRQRLLILEAELRRYGLNWADAMRQLHKAAATKPSTLTAGEAEGLLSWLEALPETAA